MQVGDDLNLLSAQISENAGFIDKLRKELGHVVIGQTHMVDCLLIGLLSNGHVLLEGVPGLAKTLTIKALSMAVDAQFNRIQFTPDLLPADVVGTMIYNQQTNAFQVRKGPVFANFILADEINRAPAKVQSALLEAMQERQVTIGELTHKLPQPFLVLATQNPIEQEGTYPLPEAQVDRFMLKVQVGYPSKAEEQLIIRQQVNGIKAPTVQPVVTLAEIEKAKELTRQIYMDEKIEQYIINIVFASRYPSEYGLTKYQDIISFGGSPRASINLGLAAKAHAFMQRRAFVIPDDVRAIAQNVMAHRIGLTYEAEANGITSAQIVNEILQVVQVP